MSIEESVRDADTAPPPEPDAVTEPAPPVRRPRRRGLRTLGLIAVAAVVGLVGGTAVGYRVQADREPTALPPLNQPGLAYPAKPLPKGQEPAPLSAKEDRRTKAQGDLRKLLLPRPAGARKDEFGGGNGWMPVYEFASRFDRPDRALDYQLDLGIRRVAAESWVTGEHKRIEIRLVQYRANDTLGAQEFVEDQQDYMPHEDYAGNEGKELKGSSEGRYYLFPADRKAGYLDFYEARAYFHRGDIAVEIFVGDTEKISEKEIRSLAERQLGRL
ncbi:hypothetical protein GCM10010275_66130 [Streptomyces litmocidini]|uniref:hypothetical protein n=1 Tax=Streptomyces litmocidini TaxID=67318 RepID=UPI0019B7F087|nr:hypothetical protein [Streptomyces litmocidini]GGV15516.1 hypothetical protein GCM10010275_66130 [Streptomyces litmocidini]